MIRIGLVLTLVTLSTCLSFAWEKPRIDDILGASKAGVVKLIVSGTNAQQLPDAEYGSGFVVSREGFVISAAHIFSVLKNVSIRGRIAYFKNNDDEERENLIDLDLVSSDVGTDVALLKFSRIPEGMRPLPIAKNAPLPGESVHVLGFPGGQNLSTSYPAVYQGSVTPRRFQFLGISNRGNSGGPIVNSEGYVVGIVAQSEDRINSVPVTNIYRGIPASDLSTPRGFDPSSVRPLFIVPEHESSVAQPRSEPDNPQSIFESGEAQNFCNVNVPGGWQVRRSPKLGFAIFPPSGSDLLAADFRFEFLVRGKEPYIARQEARNSNPRFEPAPYSILPLAMHSVALMKARLGPRREGQKIFALMYSETEREFAFFRYLPRSFNSYQFRPEGADSAFLLCSAKKSANRTLASQICERLISQAVEGYYGDENPCLPGSAGP